MSPVVTVVGGPPMLTPPVSPAAGGTTAIEAPPWTELVLTDGSGRALETLEK